MARKLKSKGFDEAAIADALGAVASLGLQSDGRFLEAFVRGQFAKGRGPWRIGQEARLKGMDAEGLAECLADYDWDAALARIHDKKFGAAAPADRKDYAARVRFLSQRGFEPDRIQALLRRLGRGGDEF